MQTAPQAAAGGTHDGPRPWQRLLVALLAASFLVTPFLIGPRPNPTASLGNELVGDGLGLVAQHEVLLGIQSGERGLGAALTASWWGEILPNQSLYRPIPTFLLGAAGKIAGPYNQFKPGSAAFPYKLIAAGLHVAAALALLDLAFLLLGSRNAALIASALFAALPVHCEPIYDVSGIAELSCALFSFGAWAAWIRAGERPLEKPLQLATALLLVLLATLCKESAFALPLVFAAGDVALGRGAGLAAATRKLTALATCALPIVVSLALRYAVLGALRPEYTLQNVLDNPLLAADVGALERVMNALRVLAASIPIALGPNPLSANWSFSPDYSFAQFTALPAFAVPNLVGAAVVVGLLALACGLARRCATVAGLILAYFAALLVTSNVFLPIGTIFGERLLYFPSAMLVLLLGAWLARAGTLGTLLGLLLGLGGAYWSQQRADEFKSQASLWNYASQESAPDSARAHVNAGVEALVARVPSLARESLLRAIEIFPDVAAAHAYLGAVSETDTSVDPQLTAGHYQRAFEIMAASDHWRWTPETKIQHLGASDLLYRVTLIRVFGPGATDPAAHLAWLDEILQRGYESPSLWLRKAETLRKLGRPDEVGPAYQQSLAIQPLGEAVLSYARFLRDQGRDDEAAAVLASHRDLPVLHDELQVRIALLEIERDRAPEKCLDEIRALLDEHGKVLEPQQFFRVKLFQAQCKVALPLPRDPAERTARLTEIQDNLMGGLTAFKNVTAETFLARRLLIGVWIDLGKYADARRDLEEMLRLKRDPGLSLLLAGVHVRERRYEDALIQFRDVSSRAVDAASGAVLDAELAHSARLGEIDALRKLGRAAEAEGLVTGWVEAQAPAAALLGLRLSAVWQASQGKLDLALAAADELVARAPEDAQAAALAASVERARELSAAAGDDPARLSELAALRQDLGDSRGAESAARAAAQAAGDAGDTLGRATFLFQAAAACEQAGDLEAVLQALDEALALDIPPQNKAELGAAKSRIEALLAPAGR